MAAAGGLVLFDGSAPPNPASGYETLYFNSSAAYLLTSAGASIPIGGPVAIVTTVFTANAYTLALADGFTAQQASNAATPASITVPTNASVAFVVGTVITFTQTGSGKISLTAAGGVTIISSISGGFVSGTTGCRAQNSTIGLLKTGANAWTLSGDAG